MIVEADNYKGVAPYYDILSQIVFRGQLVASQNYFLMELGNPASILIFGGGTGQMIPLLLKKYPKAEIHFLDSSKAMIAKAKARVGLQNGRVRFTYGTEMELKPGNRYDVILTAFVLDNFENPRLTRVYQMLLASLQIKGKWIHTDFYLDQKSPYWQRKMVDLMYWFFGVTAGLQNQTLPDFNALFSNSKVKLLKRKYFFSGMVRTHLYQKRHENEPTH